MGKRVNGGNRELFDWLLVAGGWWLENIFYRVIIQNYKKDDSRVYWESSFYISRIKNKVLAIRTTYFYR